MNDFDIIIKNGKIIEGTGNPWFYGDVGVKDGYITKVCPIDEKKVNNQPRIIDASNLIVCPGFIDMHSHADSSLLTNNKYENLIRQGITTFVGGNCGSSLAPIDPKQKEFFLKLIASELPEIKITELPWYSFKEYLKFVKRFKTGLNFVPLVGLTTIRASYLQMENRPPTSEELESMKSLVEEAMQAGAFGFSTGLIYSPQRYAKTEEIIELAKISGKYNGFYFSHIRDEADNQMEALKEFIEIVEKSGVLAGQIAHHKIQDEENWGMSRETLKLIEDTNKRGITIRLDQYPYIRGMNSLINILPGWAQEGGREMIKQRLKDPEIREKIRKELKGIKWDKNFVAEIFLENWKNIEGLDLAEISTLKGYDDPFDLLVTIILESDKSTGRISEYGHEDDVKRIMENKFMMVGTDASGVKFGKGAPHPRYYGTYPRILGKYVRGEKVISLEEAIRKMTSFPAQSLGLQDRGIVKEGMWADLVIFDEERIIDKATYKNPHQYPEGIEYVLINGKIAVDQNKFMGILAGKILTRPW